MLVKLDPFCKDPGENNKKHETTTYFLMFRTWIIKELFALHWMFKASELPKSCKILVMPWKKMYIYLLRSPEFKGRTPG